jgi:hypothetical protein
MILRTSNPYDIESLEILRILFFFKPKVLKLIGTHVLCATNPPPLGWTFG